jgi:hypothetical protein
MHGIGILCPRQQVAGTENKLAGSVFANDPFFATVTPPPPIGFGNKRQI